MRRRFESCRGHPCDVSGHSGRPEPASGFGSLWFSGCGAGWSAGAVVAAGGVDGELAEDLAGGGVDDAYVEVGDEQDDAGSGVGSADGDVVQLAVESERDVAAGGDAVVADPVVGVVVAVAGAGFGSGGVGDGGGVANGACAWAVTKAPCRRRCRVEGRRVGEVAATYGVARSWVYDLVARWRREGDAALSRRSRRPRTSPAAIRGEVRADRGLRPPALRRWPDAGSDTDRLACGASRLRYRERRSSLRCADRVLWRRPRRTSSVVVQPFEVEQPNEMWQSDFTHYPRDASGQRGHRPTNGPRRRWPRPPRHGDLRRRQR